MSLRVSLEIYILRIFDAPSFSDMELCCRSFKRAELERESNLPTVGILEQKLRLKGIVVPRKVELSRFSFTKNRDDDEIMERERL